jgi:hypothetical protein
MTLFRMIFLNFFDAVIGAKIAFIVVSEIFQKLFHLFSIVFNI